MRERQTAIGVAVLFALALSAFSAASASGFGATAFTCVKNENAFLFGPHCLKSSTGDVTRYTHEGFSGSTTVTATNANTASNTTAAQSTILRSTLSGINTEVTCASVSGEGPIKNAEEVLEMYAHFEGALKYTGCVVKVPAEKGCKVKGGAITTNTITGRTNITGERVKFSPKEEAAKLAEITIEGCSIGALNNTFPVTGTLEAKTNGATLTSTHAEITEQNTLKFGGQKAGLDGALTLKNKANGTAISVTQTF